MRAQLCCILAFLDENFPFEIIADEERELATALGMLDPAEKDSNGMPLTARAVFIVDPKKQLRAQILYPATTGRNFEYVISHLSKCYFGSTSTTTLQYS